MDRERYISSSQAALPLTLMPVRRETRAAASQIGLLALLVLLFMTLSSCRAKRQTEMSDGLLSSQGGVAEVAPRRVQGAPVIGVVDLVSNRNGQGDVLPEFSGKGSTLVIVSRPQFVVGFDLKRKVPQWTTWQLTSQDIGEVERENGFQSDEILDQYMAVKKQDVGVKPEDYTNTCFDRGHQAPSKDRSRTPSDNQATFYMSNMAPQTPFLNRGVWAKFEAKTRDLVPKSGGKVHVVAGPVLRDGREGIGPEKAIAVPEAFYKIVYVFDRVDDDAPAKVIAVVMPNVTANGLDPLAEREANCREGKGSRTGSQSSKWEDYVVSVADVEQRTGLKFPLAAQAKSVR